MGKHLPGTPVNWLKFWVYLCKGADLTEDSVWKANKKTNP